MHIHIAKSSPAISELEDPTMLQHLNVRVALPRLDETYYSGETLPFFANPTTLDPWYLRLCLPKLPYLHSPLPTPSKDYPLA